MGLIESALAKVQDSAAPTKAGERSSMARPVEEVRPAAVAPSGPNVTRIAASDGPILLPATTMVDQIRAVGNDLVITLPDGQTYVIVDGAIDIPEIIVGNVRIPSANIAALLAGREPAPAAGAPQSSGGNFAEDVSDIASAFDIGDLLPPTEFFLGQPGERDLVPALKPDDDVEVKIATPGQPAGAREASATTAESGLPQRGDEPAGSNSSADTETVTGTIQIDAQDGPFTVLINDTEVTAVGDTIETRYGQIVITSITPTEIGYSYTQIDNSTDPAASELITVTVTDSDGDVGTATLTITLDDDAPAAADDTDSLEAIEGGAVSGNVITDAEGNGGADTPGADGATVTGIAFGGTQGTVGQELQGAFGALVLEADGSYSYSVDAENPVVLQLAKGEVRTETFTYTLTDGDGDTSTASLVISVVGTDDGILLEGLASEGADGWVSESGLPTGTVPDPDVLVTSGSFSISAIDGLATLTIAGETVFDGKPLDGAVIDTGKGLLEIVSLTPQNGAGGRVIGLTVEYRYTLVDNTLLHTGADDVSLEDVLAIVVSDTDGTELVDSLVIAIDDDLPAALEDASISVSEGAPAIGGNLLDDDLPGADGATLTSVVIDGVTVAVAPSGVTSHTTEKGTYTFQADGVWSFDPVVSSSAGGDSADFSYAITDGDGDVAMAKQSILIIDGSGPAASPPVPLQLDETRLADGSAPAPGEIERAFSTIVFTRGSDEIASIAFGDTDGLGGGLDWVRDSDTSITGWLGSTQVVTLTLSTSGTTATVTATLLDNYQLHMDRTGADLADLGLATVIATDSDGDSVTAEVPLSVSDDVPSISVTAPAAGMLTVDETHLSQAVTADFRTVLNAQFNADGPGSITYALAAQNAAGLTDVETGNSVGLRYDAEGAVVGFVLGSPSLAVFTLSIDEEGQLTLVQHRAVRHADANDADDTVSLAMGAIRVVVTIVDGDGDEASIEVDLGRALTFRDDGPQLELTSADGDSVILTTHDAASVGPATDLASASFAGAFSLSTSPYGADGAGHIVWSYGLALGSAAANSGLISNGVPVTLALVDGAVIGSAGANPVFSVTIDQATGVVTLRQFAELDHPLPGATGNYGNQLISLAADLVLIHGSATITDRDGDSMTKSLTIDLGGNIRFADDGPTISVSGAAPELAADESDFAVNPQQDLSGLFSSSLGFGADGTGSIVYALHAVAGPSGLIDALTNEAVMLSIVDGVIYGKTEAGGLEVFRISINGAGVATFNQSRAVLHTPDAGADQPLTLTGANLLSLTATVTDGDGDTATATADITDRFIIHDDAPLAVADTDSVVRDGDAVADGNALLGSGGVDFNDSDGVADRLSADGGTRVVAVSFGATAGTLGSRLDGAHGFLTIDSNGFYRYSLNADDAAVIALGSGENLSETFTYTIEDKDGDRSSATITISIAGTNDQPIAKADTNWVLDGASGSDPIASGNVLSNSSHPGAPSGTFADVADFDPDGDPLAVANPDIYFGLYGTLVLAADGTYTYHLDEDRAAVNALDAGQTLTDKFNYTTTDGGLTGSTALTITIFGTNDAPVIGTSTARISEEGIAGGNADSAPDALTDTTDSAIASGTLAIADPDAGEVLTVTLGDPGPVLTVNGAPVVWSGVGTSTLTGSVGGQTVITVSIANSGAYTVTLAHGVDHPTLDLEDVTSFAVPVRVSDGNVTTINPTALTVTIEDDRPAAAGESGSSAQPHQDVNALFVLDFSNSIDDGELNTMITAVKAALTQLDAATTHTLAIKFVVFSSGSFASPSFASAADANSWLASLNPADGGVRPSPDPEDGIGMNTNYTKAIQTALDHYEAVPGANNQVVFISDGNPNSSVQFGGGKVINSLLPATANAWNTFVDTHGIGVTVIGVNNDPLSQLNLQRLADVDLNDAPHNQPILISDFDSLMSTLLNVIVPPSYSGDLDANDQYGGDGGRILSIEVGTTVYTWDGAATISLSSGGTIAGTVIAALTPQGGTLNLDFATGQYNYQPPSPITVTTTETFAYTLVDGDGDTATTTLAVSISTSAPPVVLDLDGDGLEFVTAATGARFDFDGDGVAESTAWVGSDDGLLAFDANGDGKVSGSSEIVFSTAGLTDLQGLAATHDTNRDGILDSGDTDFAKFGVWRDADGDGEADAGEFTTLSGLDIASIDLTGTGRSYYAADQQVLVHAESTYTLGTGAVRTLADVSFQTNIVTSQAREANTVTASAGTAMLAAGIVAAAHDMTTPEPENPEPDAPALPAQTSDLTASAVSVEVEPATEQHPFFTELNLPLAESGNTTDRSEASAAVEPEAAHAHIDAESSPHAFADLTVSAVEIDVEALAANASFSEPGFATASGAAPSVAQVVTEALAHEDGSSIRIDDLIDALAQSSDVGDAALAPDHADVSADNAFATLLQPLGDVPGNGDSFAGDWFGAHQALASLTDQHMNAQLEAAAAGNG